MTNDNGPVVIAISGRATSGKDTSATIMSELLTDSGKKVLITHYADLLKYVCEKFLGWDGSKDEYGRDLLQRIGTDVIRRQNPDFWVDFIVNILSFFGGEWEYVLIPDARFPNEINKLSEAGFGVVHLHIARRGHTSGLTNRQMLHESETALDSTTPDYTIANDGDLSDLRRSIEMFIKVKLHGAH